MRKWVFIAAGVLAVLLAALASLPWFLNTPAFEAYVSQTAIHALGRPVKFESLSIAAFPLPTVKLRGLEVADDPAFGTGPFLTVGEGRLGIRVKPLLSGRVELANLTLEEPKIELVEDARGRWNWASLGAAAPSAAGAPRSGGRVEYRKVGGKSAELQVEKINLTVSQTAPGAALRLHGDAVAQPGDVRLKITDASLTPAGARSLGEMPLQATVEVEARDVAPVGGAIAAAPALAGAMKGRLEISGTAARIAATGRSEER